MPTLRTTGDLTMTPTEAIGTALVFAVQTLYLGITSRPPRIRTRRKDRT